MGSSISTSVNVTQAGDVWLHELDMGSGWNGSVVHVESTVAPTSHRLYHCLGKVQTNSCTMTDEDYVILGVLLGGLAFALIVGCCAFMTPPAPTRVPPHRHRAPVFPTRPSFDPADPNKKVIVITADAEAPAASELSQREIEPLLSVSMQGMLEHAQ